MNKIFKQYIRAMQISLKDEITYEISQKDEEALHTGVLVNFLLTVVVILIYLLTIIL